jgi:hypothetical protein
MTKFNTIHIFGFGDTQLIGSEVSGTIKSTELAKLSALVEHIKTFKPEDVTLTDYHVIHIFNDMDIRYLGTGGFAKSEKNHFSVKISEINSAIFEEFVTELSEKVTAKKAAAEAATANANQVTNNI